MRRPLQLVLILAGVAAAVAAVVLLPVRSLISGFLTWVEGLGPLAPVVIAAAYVPATVLFVPGSLITLGAGFVCGVLWGTVAVSVGSTVGATAAFLAGRYLLRGWVETKLKARPRFQAFQHAVGAEGFRLVVLTRLSPLFPFTLLNYAFGVTRVRVKDYVLGSWLGMLPGTILYVAIGAASHSLATVAAGRGTLGTLRVVLLVVGLLATAAVVVLVARAARRALAEAMSGNGAAPVSPRSRRSPR